MTGTPSSKTGSGQNVNRKSNSLSFKGLQEKLDESVSGGVRVVEFSKEKDNAKYVFVALETEKEFSIMVPPNSNTYELGCRFFEEVYRINRLSKSKIKLTGKASKNYEKMKEHRSSRVAGNTTAKAQTTV